MCNSKWIPDIKPCEYALINGQCPTKFDEIKPILLCEDGFEDDGFGNCVGIKNKLTNLCAKNIFTELNNGLFENHPLKPEVKIPISNPLKLNFSEHILKLFNDNTYMHLTIQNDFLEDTNASTDPVTNIITMNNSYLATATKLSIARTMIHESVHAYLNNILKYRPGFENMDLHKKMRQYAKDKGYNDLNRFHHEFMGQYVDAIAYSLYEWDKNYGTGGILDWDYYKSMAFGGLFYEDSDGSLQPTDSFKELVPNKLDRKEIIKILFNEQESNNNSKGSRCK